jgi:hypothetical protein
VRTEKEKECDFHEILELKKLKRASLLHAF